MRTDGVTDMKLLVAFRYFSKSPKKKVNINMSVNRHMATSTQHICLYVHLYSQVAVLPVFR
jgi:hypothetical protein